MTGDYSYEKIYYRCGGNASLLIAQISRAFSAHDHLQSVCSLAREVAGLVTAMAAVQQEACAAVCPGCQSVCCINRHAYHEHEDVVYLAALGEQMPSYDLSVPDTAPCQFLGEHGCTISRHLRPHRCNAYFCTPMLDYLGSGPAPGYRQFIQDLERINRKREEMLAAFYRRVSFNTAHAVGNIIKTGRLEYRQ